VEDVIHVKTLWSGRDILKHKEYPLNLNSPHFNLASENCFGGHEKFFTIIFAAIKTF
jgi:hypothetical protein